MNLKGLAVMDENQFNQAVGDLDESISGSDTASSDEEDSYTKTEDSTLTALLRKQAKISGSQAHDSSSATKTKKGPGNAPIYWMDSSKLPEGHVLGVYRALFSVDEQAEAEPNLVDIISRKQLKPILAKNSGNNAAATLPAEVPHVFLCMVGGGHFAAMVVALAPEVMKKAGGTEERHAKVLAHKTFHRYTTRRKQGGAQSAKDNAKGGIHSAGSALRRYNETALESDIRNLLSEWKSMIDSSQLLFIRATGTTNRRTLFGPYEGQVLRTNDPRIRTFPFSTRRATQSELMRSFTELTRLKVSSAADLTSPPKEPPTESAVKHSPHKLSTAPKKPVLTEAEESLQFHSNQISALVRRSKAPALLSYFTNNALSPSLQFFPINHHTPTPLHLASSLSSPALVLSLMTRTGRPGADPTIPNSSGSPPFDLAGNLQTRLAFRVARGVLGEDVWNWFSAHIPSALSQTEADTLLARSEESEKVAEAERRRQDLERINKEEREKKAAKIEKTAGKGRELGMGASGPPKTAQEVREEETRGMTPEMRTRLERERRARAAEDRLKRMQGGG